MKNIRIVDLPAEIRTGFLQKTRYSANSLPVLIYSPFIIRFSTVLDAVWA
jgi:hypothetical protein